MNPNPQLQPGSTVFFERGRTWTLVTEAQACSHEGRNDRLIAKATRDATERFPVQGDLEYVILDRYHGRLTDGTYRIIDFMRLGR